MEEPKGHNVKVYIPVSVAFRDDGEMFPRAFLWEDGHRYKIDRVVDIRPAYAAKAGGQGDRYTIVVDGKQSYLFFERNPDEGNRKIGRWFIERK